MIPAPVSAVWAFFASPKNLNALTPPSLRFQLLGEAPPMYAGQMISYRIRVAPLVRLRWLTEIVHLEPGRYFVDEQRIGPYRVWHHEHHFKEVKGGVLMTDFLYYAMPLGALGRLANAAMVKNKVKKIFEYREKAIVDLFGAFK